MHLVSGFFKLILAHLLALLYRAVHVDFIGARVVRLCCSAFTAGAGLDESAVEIIRGLGSDGVRLLESESQRRGPRSIASLILKGPMD